ncbi:DUF3822 family protein [Hymenobacter actinosclerus]|uniref:DUF3822 domain-containing protein n=1 Tax=Hymenobacter actinosclerus TaxID=82805 RepID=A0A1I0B0Q3_9BACT|nr:DUF3822 family protein [Hymenobacter actinosclerus]SET00295.1 Protein of unknown function [Hymenobacter actinosclerus]
MLSSVAPASLAPAALHRLRDETLDPEQLAAYNLYITAGPASLRLGVADARRNKFLALEEYAAPEAGLSYAQQLAALAAEHDLLGRSGWHRVRLAVHNRAFTLLPAALFRPGDETAYLSLHHALNPGRESVHAYAHSGLDIVSLFAADRDLTDWFGHTYPAGRLVHGTTPLLQGVVQQSEASGASRIYLSIGPGQLTVLVMQGKQPRLCNVYPFSTPEDLIYYVILVMQELQLDPDQDPVVIWGDLMHDSELFTILRKYIRHLRFGNRPFDLGYSYRLNDLFEYRYFELFALHLCE